MTRVMFIILTLLPVMAMSGEIRIVYPSAVIEAVDAYRAKCAEEGGELELNGDEISTIWTDEGEEAYVIRAAFTCGAFGQLWCGAMGHCPTSLVIRNKLYDTNRILQEDVVRISKTSNGTISYWLPDGTELLLVD